MGRIVQKLKLTPEKKLFGNASGIRNECSSCECSIGDRIGAVNLLDLVFVDEIGCNLAMTLALCSRTKRHQGV